MIRSRMLGGQRGRQRAADHPAKETPARTAGDAAGAVGHQLVEDGVRRHTSAVQRFVQALAQRCQRGERGDGGLIEAVQMGQRMGQRLFQHGAEGRISGHTRLRTRVANENFL
ncbi:MAG: hypothetical protein V4631_21590 [Pseudomonadota bacterium]